MSIPLIKMYSSPTEEILNSTGSLDTVKVLCEGIHTQVGILKEWNSDLSLSMAKSQTELGVKIDTVSSNKEILKKVSENMEKLSTQLGSIKSLIIDALKVGLFAKFHRIYSKLICSAPGSSIPRNNCHSNSY